jgi:signal peptidase I
VQQKSVLRLIAEPIAIAIVLAVAVRSLIDIYSIPSDSMEPALQAGDHILVTPYRFGDRPQRGQVVVFRSPRNAGEFVVKRIVAVPGDLVATTGRGQLMIGDHIIVEPYLRDPQTSGSIAPQIVPGDCYFVMGDNRRDSLDSRSWGVLPRDLIVGRARVVLWSSGGSSTPAAAAWLASHPTRFLHPIAER